MTMIDEIMIEEGYVRFLKEKAGLGEDIFSRKNKIQSTHKTWRMNSLKRRSTYFLGLRNHQTSIRLSICYPT